MAYKDGDCARMYEVPRPKIEKHMSINQTNISQSISYRPSESRSQTWTSSKVCFSGTGVKGDDRAMVAETACNQTMVEWLLLKSVVVTLDNIKAKAGSFATI